MKKVLVTGMLMLISIFSFAQVKVENSYTYSVSNPYKVFDAGIKTYFSKNNTTTAIKIAKSDILVQRFNNDKPAFVNEKLYEKALPKGAELENISELKDKYVIFYNLYDRDNKVEQLFALSINIDSGEFNGSPKLIFKIDGKLSVWSDKFTMYKSHDKSKILIKYRRVPKEKRDKLSYDVIGFHLLDESLNQVNFREITMPYTERKTENLDYQLNSKGDLYMLEKVFHDDSNKDRKSKKDETPNYHLEILTLESNSNEFKTTKLDLQDKFIKKLWFFDSSSDKMIFGGLYNSGSKNLADVDGIVTFSLNKDYAITNKNFIEIPLELINQNEKESFVKKNIKKEAKEDEDGEGASVKNLYLRDLKVHEDGSITIIGEEDYIVVHTSSTPNGGMSSSTTYYYGDVYVSKLDPNGKLSWMKKIPKLQAGKRGLGGMSYKYLFNNNSHFVVFLDNVKNIDLAMDKPPYKHSDGHGGYLTCVKINDVDGAVTKGTILNVRDIEDFNLHQISMDRVFQSSDNSFMMEAYKKKKEDIMLKINLN